MLVTCLSTPRLRRSRGDEMDLDAVSEPVLPSRVLITDVDPNVLRQTNRALVSAGFVVAEAADAERALTLVADQRFDLLVLDSTMFGADGVAVCTAIRGRARTPIIVSSASGAEADVVRALNLGADDYVIKPLKQRTLLARIHAILRRSAMSERGMLGADGARARCRGAGADERYDASRADAARGGIAARAARLAGPRRQRGAFSNGGMGQGGARAPARLEADHLSVTPQARSRARIREPPANFAQRGLPLAQGRRRALSAPEQ